MTELSTMLNNFKGVSVFSPFLVSSKHFAGVHLKTAKVIASDDAPYIQLSLFLDFLGRHDDMERYTCQLFLRYKREIFILGELGFLKTTRSFPKIPEEVRSPPKKSEDF